MLSKAAGSRANFNYAVSYSRSSRFSAVVQQQYLDSVKQCRLTRRGIDAPTPGKRIPPRNPWIVVDVDGEERVVSSVGTAVDDGGATNNVWSELGSGLDRSGFGGELVRRRWHDYQSTPLCPDTAAPATALVQ